MLCIIIIMYRGITILLRAYIYFIIPFMWINVLITDCVSPNNCKSTTTESSPRFSSVHFRAPPFLFRFFFLDMYTIFRTLYAGYFRVRLVFTRSFAKRSRRDAPPSRSQKVHIIFIRALYKIIHPPDCRASLLLGKRQNWRKTFCAPQSLCWFIIKYIPLGTLFLRISPIYVSAWFNGLSSLYAFNDAIVARIT